MFERERLLNLESRKQEALDGERTDCPVCACGHVSCVCPGRGGGQEPLLALPLTCTSRAEGQAHGSVAPAISGAAVPGEVTSRAGWFQLQLAASSSLLLQRDLPYPDPDRTGRATEALLQALSKIPQTQQRLPHQCDGRMEAFEEKHPMFWSEPSSQP